MQTIEQVENALNRAAAYLDSRQCANGGFCFYRFNYLEEPNVHDTYHALACYRLLQRPLPNRQKIVDYLLQQPVHSHQPYYLYYYVYSLRLLKLAPADETVSDIDKLRLEVPNGAKELSGWLDAALKISRMKRDFHLRTADAGIAAFLKSIRMEGGYGIKPNLEDTYLALSLLNKMDVLTRNEDTIGFVEDMQIPSFAFRNTRDSLYTNTSILHAGIGSCFLLGIPVRYPEVIEQAVLASQCANGAFASAAQSLPNLHTHYLALKLINILDSGGQRTMGQTGEKGRIAGGNEWEC